jgi:hypothetical protein
MNSGWNAATSCIYIFLITGPTGFDSVPSGIVSMPSIGMWLVNIMFQTF